MLHQIIIMLLIYVNFSESRQSLPDKTNNNFLNECLNEHNKYRRRHSAPDLRLDNTITTYSKRRSKIMSRFNALAHGHKGLKGYGENIFWGIGGKSPFSCADAVRSWYNEVSRYDFSKPTFNRRTGHFTQVVWVNTRMLGCARSAKRRRNNQMEVYIVCNYFKPGNVQRGFGENVLRQNRRSKKRSGK